jgi:hypothetical protein
MSLLKLARRVPAWAMQAGCLTSLAFVWAATPLSAEEPLFKVLNPTGNAPPIERRAMAPRPSTLDGRTVYLVDVTFNGGDLFLQQMQQWMATNLPKVKTIYRAKKGVYAADDPELWKEIKAVDGLMIMAIGH